jgi:hypothetical protein
LETVFLRPAAIPFQGNLPQPGPNAFAQLAGCLRKMKIKKRIGSTPMHAVVRMAAKTKRAPGSMVPMHLVVPVLSFRRELHN